MPLFSSGDEPMPKLGEDIPSTLGIACRPWKTTALTMLEADVPSITRDFSALYTSVNCSSCSELLRVLGLGVVYVSATSYANVPHKRGGHPSEVVTFYT